MKTKPLKQKNNLKTLNQFVIEQYGKKGTLKRNGFERGYESFYIEFLISSKK